jgi:hypothetical protein
MTFYKTCTVFSSIAAAFLSKRSFFLYPFYSSEWLPGWLIGGLGDWRTGGLEDWRTGGLEDWGTGGLILRFLTLLLFYGVAISFLLPHILERTVRKYVTFMRQIFRS